jgi:hypothetical protein
LCVPYIKVQWAASMQFSKRAGVEVDSSAAGVSAKAAPPVKHVIDVNTKNKLDKRFMAILQVDLSPGERLAVVSN